MQRLYRSMLVLLLLAVTACHAPNNQAWDAREELMASLHAPQPRVATYDIHVYGTLWRPPTDTLLTRIQEEGTSFTARASVTGKATDYSFRNGSITECAILANRTQCAAPVQDVSMLLIGPPPPAAPVQREPMTAKNWTCYVATPAAGEPLRYCFNTRGSLTLMEGYQKGLHVAVVLINEIS